MPDVVIVLTTVPDLELGGALAQALVEERLAACVNIGAPMTSVYRWQGAVTREPEHQLVIKTTSDRIEALQERMHALHTYELPEFLVLRVHDGSPGYLQWVRQQTAP